MVVVFFRRYLDIGLLSDPHTPIKSGRRRADIYFAAIFVANGQMGTHSVQKMCFFYAEIIILENLLSSTASMILSRQHDPSPPTWSSPTSMILFQQHDSFLPGWSFFLQGCFLIFPLNSTTKKYCFYTEIIYPHKLTFELHFEVYHYLEWIRSVQII